MENVSRTIELNRVCEILTVGATLVNVETATASATAHTEATATETAHTEATASAHAHTTPCHVVATVSHVVATEEVKEVCTVAIAIDETKIVGELSTIWADLRNNEVNLNELFSTELSIVNGCLSIAIAPRVATV